MLIFLHCTVKSAEGEVLFSTEASSLDARQEYSAVLANVKSDRNRDTLWYNIPSVKDPVEVSYVNEASW